MSEKKEEQWDLEDSLKRMEEIISQLEKPELPLADSLKLYQEGVLLASKCKNAITDVEKEIEILKTEG